MRRYRRNSISESLSTPSGSGGSRITAGHRHSTAPEYTPPFSYNTTGPDLGERNIALGQPLVSFSPPFDAAHAGQRGHDSTFGIRVHSSGPRAPVPALLEVLPESPFALRKAGTQPPGVTGTAAASPSQPIPPPRLDYSSQEPTLAATAGIDRSEVNLCLLSDCVTASSLTPLVVFLRLSLILCCSIYQVVPLWSLILLCGNNRLPGVYHQLLAGVAATFCGRSARRWSISICGFQRLWCGGWVRLLCRSVDALRVVLGRVLQVSRSCQLRGMSVVGCMKRFACSTPLVMIPWHVPISNTTLRKLPAIENITCHPSLSIV